MATFARKLSKRSFVEGIRERGCSLLKDSLNEFNRLSICSWDDLDISLAERQIVQTSKFDVRRNLFKLQLYPSEGQPCACVCTWHIALLAGVPGKTRKCRVTHRVRECDLGQFQARIAIEQDVVRIWGTLKDGRKKGEDFELKLEKPTYSSGTLLEGSLHRGNRKRTNSMERTHEVLLVS